MRKNEPRRGGLMQGAPDAVTGIIPDPVHDDGVEIRRPFFQPGHETRRVTVAPAARPERVHRAGKFPRAGSVGRVEREHFDGVTALPENERGLTGVFERPANRGIKTGGPYRFIRHPLYTFVIVSQAGLWQEYPSVFNAVVLFTAIVFKSVMIINEERVLREDPAYVEYSRRVRHRAIPGVL